MEVSQLVFLPFCCYAHQLLSVLLWTISHGCGLDLIHTKSLKMLHKTIYKMVMLLSRYVKSYFRLFALMLTTFLVA